jgi:DNA invertase Pin-like site-specific DNA recombinase
MTEKQLRAKLTAAGTRRSAAVEAKAIASAELAELVPQAIAAGLPRSEVARLTGLSRQAVYNITRYGK